MPLGLNAVRRQSILVEFDGIVDLQLAVVKALREDYPLGGFNPSINYAFLHKPLMELVRDRVTLYNKNIVEECFMDSGKQYWKTIYDTYVSDEYDRIVQGAPVTMIHRLITTYSRAAGGMIKVHIRCDNEAQVKTIQSLFKSSNPNIFIGKRSELDLSQYSRLILADVRYLDDIPNMQSTAKYLAILNYGCNLEVIDNDVVILKDYIIKYGQKSEFQIIDSFQLQEKESSHE